MEQIDVKLWYIIRTMGVANQKSVIFFVTVPHFIIMLFIKRG